MDSDPTCTEIPLDLNGLSIDENDETQFVRVECGATFFGVRINFYNDSFALVPSPRVLLPVKSKFWADQKNQSYHQPPSVLIIGIDSISRLNMIRSLPKTKAFLESNDFIEMRGHMKIGLNTFPNMMAALTGMTETEVVSCWPTSTAKLVNCPFVWTNFSRLNYITAMVEDSSDFGTFNFLKTGFIASPTDYYLHPLLITERQTTSGGSDNCLGGGLTTTRLLLRYISAIVDPVGGVAPLFLLSWFTSVVHDDLNGLKVTFINSSIDIICIIHICFFCECHLLQLYDSKFHSFLDNIISSRVGRDAIIFFISNHGNSFGPFRQTFHGQYEDSLPFFFLRLPVSLKARFPEWHSSVETNSARLTTPFDIYASLAHLLNMIDPSLASSPRTARRGHSFFKSDTPENRTCESASIPGEFCVCNIFPDSSASSHLADKLGHLVPEKINAHLAENSLR
ncbi:uncharacterized protein LOC110853571 [Folsomia candida]|uniref:uncharacterized protein LOC110853571 n=1 Tax=Folsomia candida TaxID=158441 RepID=UPI0016053C53|nr:uncharacterized protein LOC110853571 [Folsomia candida]